MNSLADKLYKQTGKLLKVPEDPLDPKGETVIRAFSPAPRYAGYRLCRWFFTQLGIFIPYALFLLPKDFHGFLDQMGFGWIQYMNYNVGWQENLPSPLELPIKILSVGGYVFQLGLTFLFTFLSAKSQSYLLTDYSLRIRRGLWMHQQITLSLKNIQQVKYTQNLLQRLWGIGSLEVRTAGGGASARKNKKNEDKSHTGELEGLLDPISLRELLNTTIKNASSAATSQRNRPRVTPRARSDASPAFNQAVHELLLACQSLRSDITRRIGSDTSS